MGYTYTICPVDRRVFLFLYFLKSFFIEIYFLFYNLQFCTPTARLRGGRPPAALLPGGRDENVNKIYILTPGGAYRQGAVGTKM